MDAIDKLHRTDRPAVPRPAGRRRDAPRIAVVVLNWNGKSDTLQCLHSLAEVDYSNYEILVVDNGSSDGSAAAIEAAFPSVAIVQTGANLGYAGGNNAGMRAALARGAEYILLLNNDTIVDRRLLSEFVDAAWRCPEAGVFGAKIFQHSERERVWYAGARWNSSLLKFEIVTDDGSYGAALDHAVETDYACGCALLVRRQVLEKIGFLDAKFFLTYEETDFCYRARDSGFVVVYVPRAIVWHKVSASFGGQESPLVSYFMARNYLLWTERHLAPAQRRAARLQALRMLKWNLIPKFPYRDRRTWRPGRFLSTTGAFWRELRRRWREPANLGMFWGTVHYFARRFGPAPDFVRHLGRR